MAAGTDVALLLRTMEPVLDAEEYVYASIPDARLKGLVLDPVATVREEEGMTVVVKHQDAVRLGLEFTYPCRRITLNVYSSLDAVGFLAAVTSRLAEHAISVNPISGYHHDHLFVPAADAERAHKLLHELAHVTRGTNLQ